MSTVNCQFTSATPKYINSSARDGFRKGEVLYGLWKAREAIREKGRVIIVEGYKDLLAMHAAGLNEAVALCGTAATAHQLEIIRRLEAGVWLALDGDEPGRKAAAKLQEQFTQEGMEANSVYLPEGDDPDSLFRRLGRDGFAGWMQRATSHLHPMEEELLALLLLMPQLSDHPDEVRLFFEKISKTINRLQAAFLYKPYDRLCRQWIQCNLKGADPSAFLSPGMETLGEELISRYKDSIPGQIPVIRLARQLLMHYAEKRLEDHIRTLSRQIRRKGTTTGNEVWTELHRQKIYLRFVSRKLERPGAYGI